MSEETIKIQVPDWMDKAIASRAEQELTTKNAIVLKALSAAIAEPGQIPPPMAAASPLPCEPKAESPEKEPSGGGLPEKTLPNG